MKGIKAAVGAIALVLSTGVAAQTKLKWAHVYETSEPYHKWSVWAGEEFKKRTNGKYEIQVFPASSLGKESEINQGLILWVYLYRGDQLHHHGTPADLDTIVPDAAARNAGLARSPGGFTGEVAQFGRWYAYGVVPLPRIADDVGAVIFRSDPP